MTLHAISNFFLQVIHFLLCIFFLQLSLMNTKKTQNLLNRLRGITQIVRIQNSRKSLNQIFLNLLFRIMSWFNRTFVVQFLQKFCSRLHSHFFKMPFHCIVSDERSKLHRFLFYFIILLQKIICLIKYKLFLISTMKRILFGCLILWMAYGQFTSIPCPGNIDLQDLIQITQELEIMSSTAAYEQTFTTPFAATYFDHAPQSYSTIHHFEGQSFDQIHFRLSSRILPGNLEVKFQSEHMEWKIVKVTTWISGRQDIVMQKASSVSESIVEPTLLHFNNTKIANFYTSDVVILNFLTSLSAKSSNDTYGVSLQKNSAQKEAYEVTIAPSNGTVVDYIEFLYVIFNPKISFFSSGGAELEYTNLKAPQYHRVHKTFAPIKYAYFGLYKLLLNKNQLFLSMSLDQDYILSVSSQTGIFQIGASILTIGRTPKQVCSSCLQKFVWQESCISDCGGNSYPYSNYTDGGQACLTCSSKMLEQLKDDGTGCTCAEGTEYSPVLSQCLLCEAPQIFHQRFFVCSKCGNGILDEGETCDDGNFNPQDGCSPSCHSQNGYLCMSKNCTKMLNLEKTKTLSNGIYTQFSTTIPSSDLTKEFKATYLNNTPRPERTKVITQDPNKVKIICEYCLMPPTKVQIDYQLYTKSGEIVHYRLSYKGRQYKQIEE